MLKIHFSIQTTCIFQFDNRHYYPNLVIMPLDNNEHQRIDDVSTDRISYGIQSLETMGFAL